MSIITISGHFLDGMLQAELQFIAVDISLNWLFS